jgi:hypothetical protein
MTTTTKFENITQFLNIFEGVKPYSGYWMAICRGHADKNPSLKISLNDDGKISLHCFAGCDIHRICDSIGVSISDLFLHKDKQGRITTNVYDYGDYQVCRTLPKGFYQRRTDSNGGFICDLKGIQPTIYHLPEIQTAIANFEPLVVVPEGEKDVDNCINQLLIPATCNSGGAGRWKPEYGYLLKGLQMVAVVADKDDAGRKHAQQVAESLVGKVKSIKILEMPGDGVKDLSDWLEIEGNDKDKFLSLVAMAPEYEAKENTNAPGSNGKKQVFDWHNFVISHETLMTKVLEPIDFLVDGMIISYGTGVIAGPKKKRKSFLATQLSQAVASGNDFLGHPTKQGRVLHFALEDGERRTQSRLKQQKTSIGLPIDYVYRWPYWNTEEGFNQLVGIIRELRPRLIVVDTFTKCLNGKPDQNAAGDMAEFGNKIHDLALEYNVMILFIAHHGKMSTRDPGFDIRGSSAIPSSTDVNIGLYKNEDGTFELIGEGRDIADFDLRIKFDFENDCCWHLEGDAQDVRRTEVELKIWDAIRNLESADVNTIAIEIKTSQENAQTHLKRMRTGPEATLCYETVKQGKVSKIMYKLLTSLTEFTPLHYLQYLQHNKINVNDVSDKPFEPKHNHGVNDVNHNGLSDEVK